MTTPRRLRAVLKYDKNNIPLLLVLFQAIIAKMMANLGLYPAPTTPLTTAASQLKDLGDAQQGVKQRTVRASVRDAKRDICITTMENLLNYVQGLADAAPEQSAALIETAGFQVAAFPVHAKPLLAAKLGKVSGTVGLAANASLISTSTKRRFYSWQFTTDGGKTWISAASTPYAHTTVAGLPPATVCGFRVSVTDPSGQADWSQVVSILVH